MSQPSISRLPESRRAGGIVAALRRAAAILRRRCVEIGERVARDREASEAIAHLESMSDAQLRDIGIGRADIADAVRFGRRYYLERDSE